MSVINITSSICFSIQNKNSSR